MLRGKKKYLKLRAVELEWLKMRLVADVAGVARNVLGGCEVRRGEEESLPATRVRL